VTEHVVRDEGWNLRTIAAGTPVAE